jgi:two-component system OmpR family sensor kinase
LIALVLAVFISRNIASSLQSLAEAAHEVARGNYAWRIPVKGATEVRDVAAAFNRISAEVHRTQQSQQDFLANVSHDLKTPLTSIQGYSQAIMDGTAKNTADAARIIHEESARLNRLVVELTDLAQLQAGQLSMSNVPIDIGLLAKSVGERLAVVAQQQGITLHTETGTMPEVLGDGDRLAQVLTNLVGNAIHYTPSGGEIWLRTRADGGGVEVVVQDTGIGIAEPDLPRIFERFYQVDKTRGPKRGTGLGLAITHEIVAAHGGKISAASPGRGKGSTFTVWLPSSRVKTTGR